MTTPNLVHSLISVVAGGCLFSAMVRAESLPATNPLPLEKAYSLRFQPAAGAVKRLGWYQLKTTWRQKAGMPVVFEAEDSTSITLATKEKTVVTDPNASGGAALAYISELSNEIEIVTPGSYQVWYRAWFPMKGSWSHSEQMDDGELRNNVDSNFGEDQKWLWVKGPVYTLSKGLHHYLFPSPTAWCGGDRLDKVVLQLDTLPKPTGMGPDTTVTEKLAATTAELVSNRLNLEEMKSWSLDFEQADNGGKIEIACSYDRGTSWKPLPAGAGAEVTSATKRVMFKVNLIAAPDGRSPQIRNLILKGLLK